MTVYWWSHWFWITASLCVVLLLLPNAIPYVHTYPSQHEINLAYTKTQADVEFAVQPQPLLQQQQQSLSSSASASSTATSITTTTTTKLYHTTGNVAWATAAPLLEQISSNGSNGAHIMDLTIKMPAAAAATQRDNRESRELAASTLTEHKRSTDEKRANKRTSSGAGEQPAAAATGAVERQVAGAIEQPQDGGEEDIVLEAETAAEAAAAGEVHVQGGQALASALASPESFGRGQGAGPAARRDLNNYTNFTSKASAKAKGAANMNATNTTRTTTKATTSNVNSSTTATSTTSKTTTITTIMRTNKAKMLTERAPTAELVSAAIASGGLHAAGAAAAAAMARATATTADTGGGGAGSAGGAGGVGGYAATPATPQITLDQQQTTDTLAIASDFDVNVLATAGGSSSSRSSGSDGSNDLQQKAPFTLENVNKEDELRRAEVEHRARKSKELSAEYKHIPHYINYSSDSKSLLTRSASTTPNEYETDDEGNISSEALAIQRTYFLDAGAISAICFTVFGICCTVGTIGIVLYRRRYLNKPQALSEPDSSVYIDDSTMRDNSDEMYSLDNDSFLNSLEAMTIQNYWTDTVKHTKL